ncbi:hypothetical protein K0U83_17445 [bacterium]|nr:hypothetical protein [bacterium]
MADPLASARRWRAELAVQAVADFGQLIDRVATQVRSLDEWNPVGALCWADKLDRLRRRHERFAEDVGERLAARL